MGFKEEPDQPQPDFTKSPPQSINQTRRREEVLYVAGEGCAAPKIMLIAPRAYKEDIREIQKSNGGTRNYTVKPRYLTGAYGSTLKSVLSGVGIDFYQECYYTTICKWLLPKATQNKVPKEAIAWGMPALEEEILRLKPKIIVAMGKVVFDQLVDIKISSDDAKGAWFYSKKYNCQVYLMEEPHKPGNRPYMIDVFRTDAAQIRRCLDLMEGIAVDTVEEHYEVIDNIQSLGMWVDRMIAEKHTVFSVDCEWGGINHVDGELRSMQLAWKPGYAVYIKFRDQTRRYTFLGANYLEVGAVLSKLLDRKEVKYVGHHIAADLPWMHRWLGLEWYEKTLLDTEFASQCLDEEAPLGLDDLALKYTDLGKYDIDLILWKKANKMGETDGYALIPDDIIIPYALKDVDTVIRCYGNIIAQLYEDDLIDYYFKVFNPFVTDVYTSFSILGIPMDQATLEEMRKLYNLCRTEFKAQFLQSVKDEAFELLCEKVKDICSPEQLRVLIDTKETSDIFETLKSTGLSDKDHADTLVLLEHHEDALRLKPGKSLKRWLFDVKKFTPVKTTKPTSKGLSALPWSKYLEKPPEVQAMYGPSTDKQSLKIISDSTRYPLLEKWLQLNEITTICNNIYKLPILDEEGEISEEKGLMFFLASDNCIHNQLSATETGRPRAWKPNILNWQKYVTKNVSKVLHSALTSLDSRGALPPDMRKYLDNPSSIPSIRSLSKAPDGWCLVESDYQTAEVRGLAFISGDTALIDIMTKPDPQFGIHKVKMKPVRLLYGETSGIPEENQDPDLLISPDSDELLRDDSGELIHPSADLHWSLAEMMYGIPREKLDKEIHRSAAKVGNFQSMYGASAETLERKIEQDTGRKPEPGTGQRILDALARRQPVATEFLLNMEKAPDSGNCLVAASGRKRHFATHQNKGVRYSDKYDVTRLNSGMGREARNFFMQESVAATSAKAAKWLLDYYIKHNMKARPLVVLYDSVVTLCPLEEREEVSKLHTRFMTTDNCWTYHGTVMNYPIDTEILFRWSTPLTKEEKAILNA
jgi:uracil-DNA glycosylase family 4